MSNRAHAPVDEYVVSYLVKQTNPLLANYQVLSERKAVFHSFNAAYQYAQKINNRVIDNFQTISIPTIQQQTEYVG